MKRMFCSLFLIAALVGCGVEWFPSNTTTTSPSVTINTISLASGTVGTVYSQTLTASGGTAPYTWTLSSGTLPAGLTLSTAGVISGTPTTIGTSSFTVTATDSSTPALTATQTLSITIL